MGGGYQGWGDEASKCPKVQLTAHLLGLRKFKIHLGSDRVKGGRARDSKRGHVESQVVRAVGFLVCCLVCAGPAPKEEILSGGKCSRASDEQPGSQNRIHPLRVLRGQMERETQSRDHEDGGELPVEDVLSGPGVPSMPPRQTWETLK